MKKVLFSAAVDSHILNFHLPYLKWFKEQGYEVHVASNGDSEMPYVDVKYNIPFERSPFKFANFKAYKELKKIIEKNKYKLIHCHTPMGGALTRLAAIKARKLDTKVLYTAHGFHFYKGAPIVNWLLYYPVEKWLSKYTDCLITINKEDYQKVINNFKAKSIKLVNGVGIDLNKFLPQTIEMKNELRKKYNFNETDFIVLFAGELSYRKHQDLLIDAFYLVNKKIPNVKLLLAGDGNLYQQYRDQVSRLELQETVQFLGYRNDIDKLLTISDLSVSSSRQEGLPINVIEAMATGLPLVVKDCRGHRDLVINGENGFVIKGDNEEGFSGLIERLYGSKELRSKFSDKNIEMVRKYSIENVMKEMESIYLEF
ncbi:glycosyl transferase [Peribacillus simplex]|uniref:glycosyltransferase family 4 protein n=1 Tax=Peribacillus simplex TaxID=1478 RepID=UPI000777DEB8|nr:glycosyltransferase family 4 protein [Peribacillus simplex]AMM94004.1 glycosyl transferase [Peribacillus simplex]